MKKIICGIALVLVSGLSSATDIRWEGGKKVVEIDCVAKRGKLNEKCHERLYDICDGAYKITDRDGSARIGGRSSVKVEARCTGKRGNWSDWKSKNRNKWSD